MKDRMWQIVGAVSAVIAVVVAIGTFYLSQRADKMELTAEIISNTTLLNAEIPTTTKDLKLIYKNKEVPNVSISNIRISNTGRLPIRTSDIEVPLSIHMNCVEIISSKIVSSNPSTLPVSTSHKGSIVAIEKALINPMDEFTVEIVTIPKTISENIVSGVHGRIAGISQIEFIPFLTKGTETGWSWKRFIIGIFTGILAGFISSLLFFVTRQIYIKFKKV